MDVYAALVAFRGCFGRYDRNGLHFSEEFFKFPFYHEKDFHFSIYLLK